VLDIEHALVKAYGWSLYDIDRTDVDSLLPFILHTPGQKESREVRKYCDEVSWL